MKIFIDSSVFIWAYNRPESNSATIVKLLADGKLRAVISEKVVEEVSDHVLTSHGYKTWSEVEAIIKSRCAVISRNATKGEAKKWRGKIKEKDLEHLATAKKLAVDFILALDRDYEPFPEYVTPKQFVKKLGLKPSATEY